MRKGTLIAATAAGMIAAGSLAAAPANATGTVHGGITFSGPGWSIGIGNFHPPHFRPHRVCEPVYKRVRAWWHGRPHWRVIKVGERCYWVYPRPPHGWPAGYRPH